MTPSFAGLQKPAPGLVMVTLLKPRRAEGDSSHVDGGVLLLMAVRLAVGRLLL
jgi:hypothetical protein